MADGKPETGVTREAVALLRHTIHTAVNNAIENFRQDTGYTPSSITIHLTEVERRRAGPVPMYTVGEVRFDFEF